MPDRIVGLGTSFVADVEQRRLLQLIDAHIDPRINGIEFKAIQDIENGPILILRVPASWTAPHMITLSDRNVFYGRKFASNTRLDVREIGDMFVRSQSVLEKADSFVDVRLQKILGEGGNPAGINVLSKFNSMFAVHLLPLQSFREPFSLELRELDLNPYNLRFRSDGDSNRRRYNFSGFLAWDAYGLGKLATSYTQVFKNGAIEAVSLIDRSQADERLALPIIVIESEIIKAVTRFVSFYETKGVAPPIELRIHLLSVKNFVVEFMLPSTEWVRGAPVSEYHLNLPSVLISDFSAPIDGTLRPAFDTLWNAFGFDASRSYGAHGRWHDIRLR